MDRKDELNVKQVEELKSKIAFLQNQRATIQADLDITDGQIQALQADIDLLTVEYQPTFEKLAIEVEALIKEEPLIKKV